MKKIAILSALSLGFLIQGCSNIHIEKEPTLNNIKWSVVDKKVYLRTMYVQADFKENGQKRTFKDYDFRTESAPCTVIQQYSPRTNIYTITNEKETLSFECRPYFGYDQPDLRRLYLLGSTKDCEDRPWDYHAPFINSFENVLEMCDKKDKSYIQKIETRYQNWKDSSI